MGVSHNFRVWSMQFRAEIKNNFFFQSIVNVWNSLSQKAMEAKSFSIFRKKVSGG